ncbi:MAG TPA: double-strand break repair protein AddB, partial [Methylomirabilota bacterium]|nr:double-strand break repair protein AddB [Methylomirabilota bacterium]
LILADCVAAGLDPVGLVALTRHPLAAFGLPRPRARSAARALELTCLRGPRLAAGGEALAQAARRAAVPGRRGRDVHPAVSRLDAEAMADARDLAMRIRDAVAPLEALAASGVRDHRRLIEAHLQALQAIGADETGSNERLFEGAAGTALARFYAGHLDAGAAPLPAGAADLPAVLRALMQGVSVRRPVRSARVSIWGQLEARLMTVDRLVVGGLNEGVWPTATDTGPWLSRPMRARLGFPAPEQRIGLGAHDFAQALGTGGVLLTRSAKRGGAPTVPTRFLTRLTGLIGKDATDAMERRGFVYIDWARRLDDRPAEPRVRRPAPKPPVSARPRRLSVTEIERWIRDPYAIYARRVLALEPLPDLGELPHFGTRGSVLHAALARFAQDWDGAYDDSATARLIEIGREEFAAIEAFPEIHALWWPRFVAAARWLVPTFEAPRAGIRRLAERSGHWEVRPGDGGFALTGRADRIDLMDDERLSIVDFKSGTAPSDRQIAAGETPQLALEAAIARRGGFDGVPAGEAVDLIHVVLKGVEGRDKLCVFDGLRERGVVVKSVAETVEATEAALVRLVEAYCDPERGYLSRAHPFKRGDSSPYDHLARVREWSIGSDDEEGDEG